MMATAKKEKHEEMVRFSSFQQWCESTKAEKERDIKVASDQIEALEASITKNEADADKLGEEIGALNKDIDSWSSESKKSTAVRKSEKKEYEATHLDYSESIDALERAIQVLKKREKDVPQALLQVQKVVELKRVPGQVRHALSAFLQTSSSTEASAPEANAYEFQSGSVVDMLEKLRLKFQDERLALEKAEMAAKANYQVLAQKLTASIADGKKRAADRTATKAARLEDAAKAKGDLAMTKNARTTRTCARARSRLSSRPLRS